MDVLQSRETMAQKETKDIQESQEYLETQDPQAGRATQGWWECRDHQVK